MKQTMMVLLAGLLVPVWAHGAEKTDKPSADPLGGELPERAKGGPNGMGVFGDQTEANKPLPPLERLEFTLGKDLTVHLFCRAGKVTGGFGRVATNNLPVKLHVSELTLADGQLKGPVFRLSYRSAYGTEFPFAVISAKYQVQARIVQGRIEGEFLEGRNQGAIAGRVVPSSELRADTALVSGAAWPQWRGPQGNGTAFPCDEPLVRNWSEARLVWRSEAYVWATHIHRVMSGYNSPVLGEGLVFIHNPEPRLEGPYSHNDFRQDPLPPGELLLPPSFLGRTRKTAFFDEVVYAIDARTGATVWKRLWQETGINDTVYNSNGIFSSPIYRDGRLFVQGLMGRLICLDAKTGATLWETSTDVDRTTAWHELKPRVLAGQYSFLDFTSKRPGQKELQAHHTFAGGIIVCSGPNGWLLGVDPATGKRVWTQTSEKELRLLSARLPHATNALGRTVITPKVRIDYASPVRWVHQGQEYALTGNALVDPKDGKVLWTIPGNFGLAPTFHAEYLVSHNPLAVWKIAPEKVEKVWERPPETDAEKEAWRRAAGPNPGEGGWSGGTDKSAGVVAGNSFLVPARRGASWTVRQEPDGTWKAQRYDQSYGREVSSLGAGVLAGDLLIVPRESRAPGIYHWNAATGDLKMADLWLDTDNGMATSPILVDGRLFHRAQDGIVCYDLRVPRRNEVEAGVAAKAEGQAKVEDGRKP